MSPLTGLADARCFQRRRREISVEHHPYNGKAPLGAAYSGNRSPSILKMNRLRKMSLLMELGFFFGWILQR
jgi:hypothetical protein